MPVETYPVNFAPSLAARGPAPLAQFVVRCCGSALEALLEEGEDHLGRSVRRARVLLVPRAHARHAVAPAVCGHRRAGGQLRGDEIAAHLCQTSRHRLGRRLAGQRRELRHLRQEQGRALRRRNSRNDLTEQVAGGIHPTVREGDGLNPLQRAGFTLQQVRNRAGAVGVRHDEHARCRSRRNVGVPHSLQVQMRALRTTHRQTRNFIRVRVRHKH
mmetsp:Transcript_24374/g.69268  ORF Transcript_24374/g.69268 Transcript_24374/m.69268 type:complete len:215 (-) Transcript_24374:411-1055(-)